MKNKEVYILCAYTPDNDRIDILNNTLNFLKSTGKDIVLITHSPNTPNNIISKCDYFLYSSRNILLDEPEHKYFIHYHVGDLEFWSRHFNKYKPTTIAIYDMLFNGLSLVKNMKYDIAHYVEYDCVFENDNIFNFFSKKISEGYDTCVIKEGENEIAGGIFTVNVNSFSNEELKIDIPKFLNWSLDLQVTELITEKYFLNNKKIHITKANDAFAMGFKKTIYQHSRDNLHIDSVFFVDQDVYYFCNNNTNQDYHITILINGTYTLQFTILKATYLFTPIISENLIKNIILIKDNKITQEFDFSTPEKITKFKNNSYILKK